MITSTEQLTERQARQLARSTVARRLRACAVLVAYALAAGALFFATGDRPVGVGFWAGGAVVAVLVGYRVAAQVRPLEWVMALPTTVTVTAEFAAVERPVARARIRLEMFDRCTDTRFFWMLNGALTGRQIIPKGVFTPEDQARVTALLTENVGSRRRRFGTHPPLAPVVESADDRVGTGRP